MPRLFVKDYSVKNIATKLNNLEDFYVETRVKKMLISPNGIFQINGSNLTKLVPVDIPVINLDGFVVDNSYYEEKDIISQVPFEHQYVEIVEHHYCVDKKSCVHLVVEGLYKNNLSNMDTLRTPLGTEHKAEASKYVNFEPRSFYFWSLENLDNELISKEVNMLLTII